VGPLRDAAHAGRLMEAALLISERLITWYGATGIPVHPNIRRVMAEVGR
jgi:hypothetical protein